VSSETFAGTSTPITAVTWWGYFAEESGGVSSGCTPPAGSFTFYFYNLEDVQVVNYFFVHPEVEDTGAAIALAGGTAQLQRFRWPLPVPLDLAEGRVSITFYVDTPCRFFWMSSPWGDGDANAGGNLAGRDLSLCLEATWSPVDPDPPCTTTAAEDTPVNLVDGGTVESSLSIPPGDLVTDVDVAIDLACNSTAALDIRLRSPLGTEVLLAAALDADGANFDGTEFDDEARIGIGDGTPPFATAYRPLALLGALDGQPAGGTWTLVVDDTGGGSVGTIEGWSLCLATESGAAFDCPAESGASQPPFDTAGTWSAERANVNDAVFERFSGVANPITAVTWWGYFAKDDGGGVLSACDPGAPFYTITLLTPELNQAASLSGVPIVESTGRAVTLNGATVPVLRLWRAAPNVLLAEGLLAMGVPSTDDCEFYWLGSATGDGAHIAADVSTPGDLSLCIVAPETTGPHTADQNGDGKISLSELLRVIQFYNSDNYGCEAGTEDGYAPNDLDQGCTPHASDYNPQDWDIALTELLRSIQFYNLGAYHPCPEGEDGFCAGP
jgi:subtilisin-like proprotein convertase family protein